MKKLSAILLAALAVLSLAACGRTEPKQEPFQTAAVQAMAAAGAFSEELEELDGDVAFALYQLADCGLAREDLTDCAVLRSAGATCEEAAVLVFDPGAEHLDQVEQELKDDVQSQIDANADYRPAELPQLENALVERRDNTFLLVVADDVDAASSALQEQK